MDTVRDHLEAILEIAFGAPDSDYRACDIYEEAVSAIRLLNASAPQCLDNPPHCSHRLVPDPPLTEEPT